MIQNMNGGQPRSSLARQILAQQLTAPPVKSIPEGVLRLGTTALAGYKAIKEEKERKKNLSEISSALQSAEGGVVEPGSGKVSARRDLGALLRELKGNPMAEQLGIQFAIQQAGRQAPSPIKAKPGDVFLDPTTMAQIGKVPANPQMVASGRFTQNADGSLTPNPQVIDALRAERSAGRTSVNVAPTVRFPKAANKAQEEAGSLAVSSLGEFRDRATGSASRYSSIRRVNKMLTGIETNQLTSLKADAKKLFGIGLDEVGGVEGAKAEAQQMVLDGLEQLKGAASNKEGDRVEMMSPNVAMTPQGRANLEYIAERQANRDRKVRLKANELLKKVERGQMTGADALDEVDRYEDKLRAVDDETFSPPSLEGATRPNSVPFVPTAPAIPSSMQPLVDKYSQL